MRTLDCVALPGPHVIVRRNRRAVVPVKIWVNVERPGLEIVRTRPTQDCMYSATMGQKVNGNYVLIL